MPKNIEDIAAILLSAIQEAGQAILELQKTNFAVSKKSNNDIVTKADFLANDILKNKLSDSFPDYGWLSEESADDLQRLQAERIWIVDPIDGTKEFANKIPEYAVSIALVENGLPILAAVFNPATNELFHAIKGKGAWLNARKITCKQESTKENLMVLASRSEYQRGEWSEFAKEYQVKEIGSIAYKLALVAAGLADATFSLGPKSEWDIAAGVLLVTEGGGMVTDQDKNTFLFNRKDVLVNGIIATSAAANAVIFASIKY